MQNNCFLLKITDIDYAATLAREWATHVVSILDSDISNYDYYELPKQGEGYFLSQHYFDDVTPSMMSYVVEDVAVKLATPQDLQAILLFTKQLTSQHKLLIHCNAGVSRSPAVACGLLCQHGLSPLEAVNHILDIRPHAMPNEHVICLMDEVLGLQGKLIAVCRSKKLCL